ncbi:TPA: hypothetical protein N0F65_002053 [Lagenidium giganteum]|uniref:Fe2OG dioxygenase domain-containing protein n=1 Tax=Lagenidium giganteum TaxID=4803 RepID=A0AAV2ZDC7_9STRA|nr:TPA: hypothetical protein N0F65_002053 [Lagenidium giganteum]
MAKSKKATAAATTRSQRKDHGGGANARSKSAGRGGGAAVSELLALHPQRKSLRAEYLLGDLIFSIPSFLSKAECRQVQQFALDQGFTRVTQRESRDYAFRDNDRLLLRMEEFAATLWTRMAALVPAQYEGMYAVGLNPAIRFYRYKKGQRFGCHVDQSDVDPVTGYHSRFTVLFYLNDETDSELRGGHTIFYANEHGAREQQVALTVAPQTGAALVHGHGDRCLLHEGALVTEGEKYLLRTDVMYSARPPPTKPKTARKAATT